LQGTSGISFNQVKLNADTADGKWFGIFTPEEIQKLPTRFDYQPAHNEIARRQLYRSKYSIDQNGEILSGKENADVSKSFYFLDGGFLMGEETGKPLHINGSWLVLSKDVIGNDGNIQVNRVSQDGATAGSSIRI